MASEVACPNCSKKYAVSPALIGKRVRCRNCSTVFPVLLDQTADEAADTVSAPPPPSLFVPASAESQFEEALGSESSLTRRPNSRFKFPLARELDKYLPIAMVVIGALWTASQTFRSQDAGPIWTSLLRLAIVYGLYVFVIVPGIMFGIRRIAAHLKYELPPMPAWRAAAVFSLPITLGYVFWIVAGANGMFIVGCLIGLLFSAAAFWLLFRLQPQEIAPSYAAAGGGFTASVLISIGAMLLINLFLNAALKGGEVAGALRQSPIGPTFAWDPGSPKAAPHRRELADQTPLRQTPAASEQITSTDAQTAVTNRPVDSGDEHGATASSQPVQETVKVAQTSDSHVVPGPSTRPVDAIASSSVNSAHASPGTAKTDSRVFDLPPGTLEEKSPPTEQAPADDAWLAALRAKALPYVKDVQPAKAIQPCDDVIYPRTASPWVAVVHHNKDGAQDTVEVWNLETSEKVGSVVVPRESNSRLACKHLALSPDGQLLICRMNTAPIQFRVYSFKDRRYLPDPLTVAAPDRTVVPELIGFITNDRFLIETYRNQQETLEVFNVRSNRPVSSYPLLNHQHVSGNDEISPDGKWFAVEGSIGNRLVLKLYPVLKGNAADVTLDVIGASIPGERPLGIAFSPDNSKVATILGTAGDGEVFYWNLSDHRCKHQYCPGMPAQIGPIAASGGRVIDWIGKDAWLLGGDVILDADTGAVLGNVGGESIRGQRSIADDSLQILYQMNNMTRVASIQMDSVKLRDHR